MKHRFVLYLHHSSAGVSVLLDDPLDIWLGQDLTAVASVFKADLISGAHVVRRSQLLVHSLFV